MPEPVTFEESVPPRSLIPWAKNPRLNEDAVPKIAESIRRFGFGAPIVARPSDRRILAGHTRWKASLLLGLESVPVRWLELDDLRADAYALADNRLGEVATWDEPNLAAILAELAAEDDGALAEAAGFTAADLDALAASVAPQPPEPAAGPDPNATPEPPVVPVSKTADLYILGPHRLVCGDSSEERIRTLALGGSLAAVVFTDPPYGVNYRTGGAAVEGDLTFTAIPLFFDYLRAAMEPQGWAYICGGGSNLLLYAKMFERHFRTLPRLIIWDKGRMIMRHGNYHSCFEIVYVGFGEGGGHRWYAARTEDVAGDIWRIPHDPAAERTHPTQKPVALAERAIRNSCPPDGVVFDPFAGTGSTLIAAERAGRSCRAIEIEPRFVDVIVARWEAFTGKKAERVRAE